MPLLGTKSEIINVEGGEIGRVIVARVSPEQLAGPALVTVRGRLGPVSTGIVDSLFTVSVDAKGNAVASTVRPDAVLLDTMTVPTRGQAITRLALALAAAVLSLVLLVLSLPRGGLVTPPEDQ